MRLDLKRPIVFFDLETTGLKVDEDRIIEISLLKLFPDGSEEITTFRVNPMIPISLESTEIHGISNGDVANEKPFSQLAPTILKILSECDVAGYNIHNFDLPLLRYEFLRANINYDISDLQIIDPQTIFFKKEPRTLAAAYKFFCEEELEDAHSAEADIKATKDILLAQLEKYDDIGTNVSELAEFTKPQVKRADLSGRLVYNEKNEIVFNFGKHKGERVIDNAQFTNWILSKDFPEDTKNILRDLTKAKRR